MLTWEELPKVSDWGSLPKCAEALQALPSCTFKQPMKYAGAVYNTTLQIRFGAIIADHHHLWSKCRQKGGVACPWVNKNKRMGRENSFCTKGDVSMVCVVLISFRGSLTWKRFILRNPYCTTPKVRPPGSWCHRSNTTCALQL